MKIRERLKQLCELGVSIKYNPDLKSSKQFKDFELIAIFEDGEEWIHYYQYSHPRKRNLALAKGILDLEGIAFDKSRVLYDYHYIFDGSGSYYFELPSTKYLKDKK